MVCIHHSYCRIIVVLFLESSKPWREIALRQNIGTQCEVCDCTFDKLLNRRHHCRVCGDLVCNNCSKNKVSLEGYSTSQRVCDTCHFSNKAQKHSTDAKPSQKPPAKRKECQSCGKMFGLFVRRHHCRVCDRTLCQECSKYTLPSCGRACQPCFDKYTGLNAVDKNGK